MKNRLQKEISFRSAYLAVAIIALLSSLGIFTLGGGTPKFDIFFFQNYFNLPLVLTIPATCFALRDAFVLLNSGRITEYVTKHPFMRFIGLTAHIFGLIMALFFVGRVGDQYLKEGLAYSAIYPGALTLRFWTDLSVVLSRFVCPLMYIVGYFLFDGRGQLKKIHGSIGIMPPTIFYTFNKFFGKFYIEHFGGADATKALGKYEHGAPFFFYDDVVFYQKWWPIAWLAIFGLGLVIINRVSYMISMKERKS